MENEQKEAPFKSNEISIAIVGLEGTGKSATGNTILGREAFISKYNLSLVTRTTEMKSTTLENGLTVNVIDTPGLFDFPSPEFIDKEILKSIDLAENGLHAILMVFSATSPFKKREVDAFNHIKALFGDKIVDYMIIIFSRGLIIDDNMKLLNEFREPLKSIIELLEDRFVLFDNETKDKVKREKQVRHLISLVESVNNKNNGEPFKSRKSPSVAYK